MINTIKSWKFIIAFLAFSALIFYGYYSPVIINDPDNQQSVSNAVIVQPVSSFTFSPVSPVFYSLADTITLPANPGPANNGGSPNWAMFLNLIGGTRDVYVTAIKTASTAGAGAPVSFEVFVRQGNALGGPVGSGPGSSTAGWTLIDTADGFQGSVASGISELIYLGPIYVPAGDTVGVALRFLGVGPRYFGTGSPPLENYVDTNIRLVTGDGRSAPFTPTGSFFSSRALTGEIRYVVSSTTGITNLNTGIPDGFMLGQNYPNPFNPATNIKFALPRASLVTLKVYDLLGREVASLVNNMNMAAGNYVYDFNAANIPSGVYFYKLSAGEFSDVKKMTLIK